MVNYVAEKAIKLIENYNRRVIRDADQQEVFLHCVQEYSRLYLNFKKDTLKHEREILLILEIKFIFLIH